MSDKVDTDGCGCIVLAFLLGAALIILSIGGCIYLAAKADHILQPPQAEANHPKP